MSGQSTSALILVGHSRSDLQVACQRLTTTCMVRIMETDAVDPAFAPSTGTRVAGGLSYREAYFICESVGQTGKLIAQTVLSDEEYHPE